MSSDRDRGMKRVLIIDDEPSIRLGITAFLERAGLAVSEAASLGEARRALAESGYDAVLLDAYLPDGQGVDLILDIRATDPTLPIIMMTGQGTIPLAVEAMRRGADHFLTKPVNLKELEVYLTKSLQLGSLRRSNRALREKPATIVPYYGQSPSLAAMLPLIDAACRHKSPVLLRGETGTGKGLLARTIHSRSLNSREPFVELNCAGLKGEFLESELFGHTKGAFTGAVDAKEGLLERAHRGTLFLDEIGDMNLALQSKFLKVLEEKRYRPLGQVDERISDFRLISATNQNLEQFIEEGTFRRDVYFRINTLVITLPPLREMREDLPGLAHHILRHIAGGKREPVLSDKVLEALKAYSWPGNTRELHNVLERAWILADEGEIRLEHLAHLAPGEPSTGMVAEAPREDLDAAERAQIVKVLREVKGKVPVAARRLGVSRPTLYRKISQHGINLDETR
jgi:DNA-binding NtrC family response regulator